MWFTCHSCNGGGCHIDNSPCIVCSRYNIYYNGVLIFYGHVWCDDDIVPITPPPSP
jgi:hypothetical protein